MTDTPEKRAERAWRTIWRDANGHIADSFPYKPEEDDVILPEIRFAETAVREEEWEAIRGGLQMARSHERNDKAVIHNGAIGLALQVVNARQDIVEGALAGEEEKKCANTHQEMKLKPIPN